MITPTFRIGRFAALFLAVIACVSATVVAPDSSAESASRDSRSKFFAKFQSLADYVESNGGSPRTWIPTTRVSRNAWLSSIEDESVRVDSQGRAFVVEPRRADPAPIVASPESATPVADVPLADAFLLNSLPGANRTIYLDFTGHSLVGTIWQNRNTPSDNSDDYTNEQMQMPAYDVDGDTSTFSDVELQNIIDTWSAVAEDYAPFDVNVTTQDPGSAAIRRSSDSDLVFGVRAVITDEANVIQTVCGCGGIAYVDVFDYAGYNTYLGPSLNFTRPEFNGKVISDIVSHEVGHNLGLSHDGGINPPGTSVDGYFEGRDGWAPIMGVGYSEPLVQFSNGTYTSANQFEDDVSVISGNGVNIRSDEHGDALGTASSLTNGIENSGYISTRSDVDYFVFTATASSHAVSITSPSSSSNLDVQAQLFDSTGALLSTTNPNFFRISTRSASGLDADFTATTTPGMTYYIAVDGAPYGPGTTTGYSDYGSLGEYRILVSGSPAATLDVGTPSISGSAVFGGVLTGSVGTWTEGTSHSATWFRDGVATEDTDSSYSILASDIGKTISYRVLGVKNNYAPANVSSSGVVVSAGTISPSGTAAITGTAKVKKTLTARAAGWMSGVSVGYQWLRNESTISSATRSNYKLTKADKGKKISVRILASKLGYTSVTLTSAQTARVKP